MKKKKPSAVPAIPPIPERLLVGNEPLADRYSGDWQPVKRNALPVNSDDPMAETFDQWETESTDRAQEMYRSRGHVLEIEVLQRQESKHKPTDSREVWPENVTRLAISIESRHKQGEFGDVRLQKAFDWAAEHYVIEKKDGTRKLTSAKSLANSLYQFKFRPRKQ